MRLLALLVIAAGILVGPRPASAQGIEPFLGQVIVVPYGFCPQGWAEMNGQLLPINQYSALFSLMGTTYGGNGQTNFALPSALPMFTASGDALRQCIATQGIFPTRP